VIEKSKFPSRRHLLALSSAFRTMQQHIAFILNLESRGTKRAPFSCGEDAHPTPPKECCSYQQERGGGSGPEVVMTSKLLNALCSDGKNRIGC
jgi:hypothetical protein